jgi:hypothetical protein
MFMAAAATDRIGDLRAVYFKIPKVGGEGSAPLCFESVGATKIKISPRTPAFSLPDSMDELIVTVDSQGWFDSYLPRFFSVSYSSNSACITMSQKPGIGRCSCSRPISPMRLIAPVIGLRRITLPIASSIAFL